MELAPALQHLGSYRFTFHLIGAGGNLFFKPGHPVTPEIRGYLHGLLQPLDLRTVRG
jgi:hypothetical protein